MGFLSIMSTFWGTGMTIAMGIFVYKMLGKPIPFKLFVYVMLVCYAGGLGAAELMWWFGFKNIIKRDSSVHK